MNGLKINTGKYRTLLAYRKTEVIYDMTFYFCNKYLNRGDRTIDQMVQAARSGKQNIVEGVEFSTTSYEVFLKLLNTAKASLQELLEDYKDYLRVRHLRLWESDSVEVKAMSKLGREHQQSDYFLSLVETRNDEVVANMVVVLIHQADILITRYIKQQYHKFLQEGGFREKLTRDRLSNRKK
jgi:four helix bundle suffix protein